MLHYKIQTVADNWVRCRKSTVDKLRRCANTLESSHKEKAEVEHTSAKVSLTADVVGLFGVVLAPVSGGLSLGLCALSAGTGVGSYLSKRGAHQNDEEVTKQVNEEFKRAVNDDEKATSELKKMKQTFTFLEEQLQIKKIDGILVAVQQTLCKNLTITVGDIQGSDYAVQNKSNLKIPVVGVTTQLANLNAALTSAKQVVGYTQITKEAVSVTSTVKQVLSTATSVNNISKAAQSLASAQQIAAMSMQASMPAAKSAKLFVDVARGTDGVIKTAGAVSSASMSSKMAADIINAYGQIAINTAQSVSNAASNTVHIKTVTMNATKVTRVTQTATTAASISRLGLVMNAVVIPLDVYNLVVASDNLAKSHEDVKLIREEANRLEKEIENIHEEIKEPGDTFTQLHAQLVNVFNEQHIEIIYEYLLLMHETLEFPLPSRF